MSNKSELEELYQRVGKNLTFLRKAKNLSQEDLSLEPGIDCSQSVISQYERARKVLSLEKMEAFCNYFSISLKEFLFSNLSCAGETENLNTNTISSTDPIYKCANRTYYCYYIKEQNHTKNQFLTQIACVEIKILSPISSHSAKVTICLEQKQNPYEEQRIDGTIYMDESYAYIEIHDLKKDFFFEIVFYYHRQSLEPKYKGGAGFLHKMDYHRLPICQFCIISQNAISFKSYATLEKLLQFGLTEDKNLRLSKRVFSSSSILRLTKQKDSEVFEWLRQNVGI